MWIVYKHSYNNKVYIGITCQIPERRWKNGEGYKDSPHFYRAIKKYGWNNFTHEIIQYTDSLQKAQILEIMWISFYKKRGDVYNITAGGEYSSKPRTAITKQRISVSKKGIIPWNKGQHINAMPVIQYTLNDVFVKEWKSSQEIMNTLGICRGNISRACRGVYKQFKGFKWKYKF